jgi:hypothetical protein
MQGTIITIPVVGDAKIAALAEPSLEALQEAVGGFIEAVPYFDTYTHEGELCRCVAFCNEEGKLKELAVNLEAMKSWIPALKAHGIDKIFDVLVGPVAIVFGDEEFMRAL